MEHIALEILFESGGKFATLPEDASITITDASDIFSSGDVWSYEFTLNIPANVHIFGSSGDMHGSRLHDMIDKRKARLWVEGLPLYLGYLRLGDEVDVNENGDIGVSFESGQKTFEEMIDGAKANQVPTMNDVLIGMALWRKRKATCTLQLTASATLSDGKTASPSSKKYPYVYQDTIPHEGTRGTHIGFVADGEEEGQSVQPYPRMVFPRGEFSVVTSSALVEDNNARFGGQRTVDQSGNVTSEEIDCINTDFPYDDAHPYCNVALCYQRYGYIKKQKDGSEEEDYSGEPEAQRGYDVMPANRVNSAPNFFVIYWIHSLMKHLGIYIEEDQMMDVEDLRRLFFVNTNCAYKEPDKLRTGTVDASLGKYQFMKNGRDANRLVPEYYGKRTERSSVYTYRREDNIDKEESKFSATIKLAEPQYNHDLLDESEIPSIKDLKVSIQNIEEWDDMHRQQYERDNSYLHGAIATSECFPNVDISTVIDAIESGFGVRLLFDKSYHRVRIVLLRNIFRNKDVQPIACDIIQPDVKVENSIRGFRMTYGNIDDIAFYYKGFSDKLPHKKPYFIDDSDKHDYSHWNLNADYRSLIKKVSAFDKTCYVTPNTGNAHVIKVDKDAKRYEELRPSLFGCADFMDAEDGDCTGEEETIETINVGFTPAIMNDVNYENERDKTDEDHQLFALFLDETMRPRRPVLNDGVDENDPTAEYDVYDGLYAKVKNSNGEDTDEYVNAKMMDNGIVKPGEFSVRSDMYASLTDLRVTLVCDIGRWQWVDSGESVSYELVNVPVYWPITFDMNGYINEGYRLYLQDNYEPNDEGVSPVETHDWGLTLGILRGSGSDMQVQYSYDQDDGEGNDTWERVSGSSVTSHPDTCDNYGNEWDYDGSLTITSAEAPAKLSELFPDSDAPFYDDSMGYITNTFWIYVNDRSGVRHAVLLATEYSNAGTVITNSGDLRYFVNLSLEELQELSRTSRHMIVEVDSNSERGYTLVQLCKLAYGGETGTMTIDNGVGSRYGRFSLKLRAEKPNPYYDPTKVESSYNRRYLPITNENLRKRGLCDQFYKEYSYWVRNARIAKRTVKMELAQLLSIDKTVKVSVGDITGFIKKMQYSISNKTGLGMVTMEIMYI